jgi:hypothetical protein
MYILIVLGYLYGSAFGIRVEAINTVYSVEFKTEAACEAAAKRINEEIVKIGRPGGVAFCVKDG